MRIKHIVPILSLAVVCLMPQTSRATLTPSISISKLTADASLIIVGEVTSVQEVETGLFEIEGQIRKARRLLAALRVDRVIKGKAKAEVFVRFDIPEEFDFLGFSLPQTNQFGMFFLRGDTDKFSFVSPYYPSILASRLPCLTSGSALERVVAEISWFIKSPWSTRHEIVTALQYLRTVPPANAVPVLKSVAEELPSFEVLAAYLLLHHNDISLLNLLEKPLQESSRLRVQTDGTYWEFVLSAALIYIRDPAAIPVMSRLLSSADAQTRRDAVGALRNIGTEAVIAPLSKALYDEDSDVRWVAVMGLAGVAGPDEDDESWYPSQPEFKENEQRYLDHFREWVKKKGFELKITDKL